ncbi:dnaJ homolog subfamily C member 24-like [Leptopilina heterotoma]|uniref:dnaJ homolog subfamily C member 24-like n=1 Tax=Leptopilina heterotoma TaxID=63436 RepID=UPI001CA960A8|nr:dnaJ homolog subfamily C member 24-like [Leptopilina heterotoma]
MSAKDFYEILGCSEKATYEDLKSAFHKLILKSHPDKVHDSNKDADDFHEIQEAWTILSKPESRKLYDAERKQAKLEEESIVVLARITSDELYPKDEKFAYQCRCGSEYIIDNEDLKNNEQFYVACDECTFYILVQVNKNSLNLSSSASFGT